ncbi:NACHT domain-containing protein, partial [Acaryochloris marina NIES-2412]|uniref:NACHT domain-containing protein n=1 Tax=Acaryochloris marina TaxID=155978 RepID=UPI004057FD27
MLNNLHTISWLWLLADTAAKTADDDKTKQILDFLNSNPMIAWGIAGFAVIAMATYAIAKFTDSIEKIIKFFQNYIFQNTPKIIGSQQIKTKDFLTFILIDQVNKRIKDSLYKQTYIHLKRNENLQQVGKGHLAPVHKEEIEKAPKNILKRTFQYLLGSTTSKATNTNKSTIELFEQEDIQGRLLILGEPGSGKTNELLLLARELLYQARDSADKPIPVIFELSEWNAEKDFSDWLCQQLVEKYKVPFLVSDHWIKKKELIPLLDGLDELRKDKLIQCVNKINDFIDRFSLKLVVCCRRKEYEAIQTNNDFLHCLNGAIELLALENSQISEYLLKSNQNSLWETIQRKPKLLELSKSPLFLPILAVVGAEKEIRNTEELLDEYIHKQLNDLNNQGAYPPGK